MNNDRLTELLESKQYVELMREMDQMNAVDAAEFLATVEPSIQAKIFRLLKKDTASDIFTELNECIRRGTVFATIYQNPFSQAHDAFEELFFHLVDKSEIREFILAKPLAVLESNLNLYEKT